jgi:crossover junction endodeoxyribonuclease RuvC
MRVLGVDPGSRHLGWGVLERVGTRVEHVAHGVIDVDLSGSFADRLVDIDDELAKVIEAHAPQVAAVEGLFFAKDAQSAAKKQVAMVITAILRLPAPPRSDAADALAIALTHLHASSFQAAVAMARRK